MTQINAQTNSCPPGSVVVTDPPYSADATGARDSSAAFNAAIVDAGTGGTVCVPAGTYAVGQDININTDGVTVTAPQGATIRYINNVQFFIRGNGNTVSNLAINGAGTNFSGFVVNGALNTLQNCQANGCGDHGIVLDGQSSVCSGNRVIGCTTNGNGQIGIAQNHCSGSVISGCTASGNNFEGITADNQADGSQIIGNTISDNCVTGGVGGIGSDYSSGVVVSGNIIRGTKRGLPAFKTQNNLGSSNAQQIINNQFIDNSGVAVRLYCKGDKCTFATTVAGNTYSGNAATGNYCNGAVQVDGTEVKLAILGLLPNIVTC
jgi:parallel beta-helix repeat protein